MLLTVVEQGRDAHSSVKTSVYGLLAQPLVENVEEAENHNAGQP